MKAILRTKCRCERELPYVSEGTQRVYIPILSRDDVAFYTPSEAARSKWLSCPAREFEFQGERRDGVPVFVETDR